MIVKIDFRIVSLYHRFEMSRNDHDLEEAPNPPHRRIDN